MSWSGHGRLWPKPTLAKPTLAKTDFGQTEFDLLCGVLCCVVLCVVLCCVLCCLCGVGTCFTVSEWGFMCGCWFQGLVWTALPGTVLPGTALPLDRPKFRPFFSLSRRKILSFLPSLDVFSLNFGGVFEGRDTQMCPGASHTTQIPQEDTQRGKKRTKFCGRRGKKRATFWAVQGRAVRRRAVRRRAVRRRAVRRSGGGRGRSGGGRSEPEGGGGGGGPLAQIGLATKNQQGHGPNRPRHRWWPKLAQIGSA